MGNPFPSISEVFISEGIISEVFISDVLISEGMISEVIISEVHITALPTIEYNRIQSKGELMPYIRYTASVKTVQYMPVGVTQHRNQ